MTNQTVTVTSLTVNGVHPIFAKDGPKTDTWQVEKIKSVPGCARVQQGLRGHRIGQDEDEQDDEERNEIPELKRTHQRIEQQPHMKNV